MDQPPVFIPMKSPIVFLCSLKTKIYLRDRWFYVNKNNDDNYRLENCGELIEPVHKFMVEFWMCCDGCCAMVGLRLCFCCDDAFLYSCDQNKCIN